MVTQYLAEHSDPASNKFYFGYHISIRNDSEYTVQLLRRHWYIYNGSGDLREVEGEGVVGQTPVLPPGEFFQYVSYCDLDTDIGKMRGTYLFTRLDDDSFFDVPVPEFKMCLPALLN